MEVARRPLREPHDLAFLRRLYHSTRVDELAPVPWSEARKVAFLDQQFAAQHAHYRTHFASASFEILMIDGAEAGRLYVDRRVDEIRVIDIALLPEHRGAGIGGALMQEILDEAAERGLPVRIHVGKPNPARRLYDRLGFRAIADVGVYDLLEWSPPA